MFRAATKATDSSAFRAATKATDSSTEETATAAVKLERAPVTNASGRRDSGTVLTRATRATRRLVFQGVLALLSFDVVFFPFAGWFLEETEALRRRELREGLFHFGYLDCICFEVVF